MNRQERRRQKKASRDPAPVYRPNLIQQAVKREVSKEYEKSEKERRSMVTQVLIIALLSGVAGFMIGGLLMAPISVEKIQTLRRENYELKSRLFSLDEEKDDDYAEIYRRMIQRTSDPEEIDALEYGAMLIRKNEPKEYPYNGRCHECGEKVHAGWNFCPYCGKAQVYVPPWSV